MQTIRTTITLPEDLHQELKLLALKNRVSFSDVVVDKIRGERVSRRKKENIEIEIRRTMAFFRKIALEGEPLEDAAKIVREERNRDNA